MTEYDYSEEGYHRYMQTLNRVSDWVDGTNAARTHYEHAVHPLTQSTPSQVATHSRTRERSQSASYSYPQHAYHSQQNLHHPYDGGGARAGAQGAPPPRMQPTRSKTMDVSAGSHLQYTHRHVYDKQHTSNQSTGHQTQPQTQTHTRSGSRSSSRHPSPPNNSSHTTTPHHSRSASRVTSPVSASTTARQQFPPAQVYKPPPQTQQTQARHVRSSSAEPTAIRTRSRSYSYSGPSPAPPRPIPVPQPVSAVLPRREPRRSNTMPPGHHHHVYDPGHGGKERNVLRKSYDYVPGVGVGTTGIVGGGGGARGGVGMTRGGTYVAVPPGYSARVVDVRVRPSVSFFHECCVLIFMWLFVVGWVFSRDRLRRRNNHHIVHC